MKLDRELKCNLFVVPTKEKLKLVSINIHETYQRAINNKIYSMKYEEPIPITKQRFVIEHEGTIDFIIEDIRNHPNELYIVKYGYDIEINDSLLGLEIHTEDKKYLSKDIYLKQQLVSNCGDLLRVSAKIKAVMIEVYKEIEMEKSIYSAVTEAMEIAEKSDLKMGKVEDNPKLNRYFSSNPSDKYPKRTDTSVLIDNKTGREIELEAVHFTIQNNDEENQIIQVETKESIDLLTCSTTFSLSVISQYSSIEIDNVVLEKHRLVDSVYYVTPAEKRLEDLEFTVEGYPDVHTGDMIVKIYKVDHSGKQTVRRAIKLRVDPEILFELPEGAEIPQRCINNKE